MDEAKPAAQGPDDLPIDVDLLKVLASDTRRDILRLLQKRRMTLSEMASSLNLKKATILEHLKKLVEAGLIRRLEDERLWVYYELTHRGGRLVNPGRTRFFLVLGLGAAAAIVLAGFAIAAITFSGADTDRASSVGGGGMYAEIASAEALGGGAPVALKATIQTDQGPVAPVRAMLLSTYDARALQAGTLQGVPLEAAATEDGVVLLRSAAPVPAGDYYLYVSDGAGHDNAGSLPHVRVPQYTASGPTTAWRGIDDGTLFRVLRDGAPVDGTLLLVGDGAVESVPVRAGEARLSAERLDALPADEYRLKALPLNATDALPLDARLRVRDPLAMVAPLDVVQRDQARVTITLSVGSPAPATPQFMIAGEPAPAARIAEGVYELRFDAREPGERSIQVGRLITRDIVVHPDVEVILQPDGAGRLNLTALAFDKAPAANVSFRFAGLDVGETNESGRLVLDVPPPGVHELVAGAPPAEIRRLVSVDGWNVTEITPRVNVSLATPSLTQDKLALELTLQSERAVDRPVMLSLALDDAVFAAQRPVVDGTLRTLAFQLESPPAGEHQLVVHAQPLPLAPLRFFNGTHVLSDTGAGAPSSRDDSGAPTSSPTPAATPTTATPSSWEASNLGETADAEGRFYYHLDARESGKVVARLLVPGATPPPTTAPTTSDLAAFAPEPEVPGFSAGLAIAAIAAALVAMRVRRRR